MKSRMKFLIFTVRGYEFTTFSRTEECYLISSFVFTSSRKMVMSLLERNICAIECIWQIFNMQKGKILKSLVDKVSSNAKAIDLTDTFQFDESIESLASSQICDRSSVIKEPISFTFFLARSPNSDRAMRNTKCTTCLREIDQRRVATSHYVLPR